MKQKSSYKFDKQRLVIKLAGESGQGINSMGEIIAHSLKNAGFKIFAYREYPSLIRGGVASYQVEFSDKYLSAPSLKCDLLVCTSRQSISEYLSDADDGAVVLHNVSHLQLSREQESFIADHLIKVVYVDASKIALDYSGLSLLSNVVLLGVVWQLLDLQLAVIQKVAKNFFAKKPQLMNANNQCLKAGFCLDINHIQKFSISFHKDLSWQKSMIMSGNHALSLGAISSGVRAFYAYPMTPASSILQYLAEVSQQTGMLVKQVEDEICAAQMALGSMAMGTRSFTATSGGGFDLMTETVSLSAMMEAPFVCVLAQRPGPATGLPTWTSASDLNLAIYAGHGEFPRLVLACSDAQSAFTTIQHALNYAEVFQIPVILLTEKQIAESLFNIAVLPESIEIKRGLLFADNSEDIIACDSLCIGDQNCDVDKENVQRYQLSENGISLRWNPGDFHKDYNLNGDEHWLDGSVTEAKDQVQLMMDKRLKKMQTLLEVIPQPVLYGKEKSALTFVGWGSVKTAVLDCIDLGFDCNYLHFEFIYPLQTQELKKVFKNAKKTVLIEQNAFGQLGDLITKETRLIFDEKLLKYNGRPFFVEEIAQFLMERKIKQLLKV